MSLRIAPDEPSSQKRRPHQQDVIKAEDGQEGSIFPAVTTHPYNHTLSAKGTYNLMDVP
jgi:hypothetical protein